MPEPNDADVRRTTTATTAPSEPRLHRGPSLPPSQSGAEGRGGGESAPRLRIRGAAAWK